MSSISSSSLASPAQYSALFSSYDANKDGTISRAEFTAAPPQGVSTAQASSLFDMLDTAHDGSESPNSLAKNFQSLSSATEAMLIQIQGGSSAQPKHGDGEDQSAAAGDQSAQAADQTTEGVQDGLLDQLMSTLKKDDENGTRLPSGVTVSEALGQFMKAVQTYQGSALTAATGKLIASV